MPKKFKLLHIFGSQWEHDDAFIVGNRLALESLRDAIDKALASGQGATQVFAADGEGYGIYVVLREGEFDQYADVALPYSEAISRDTRRGIKWPVDLIGTNILLEELPPAWVEE